MKQTAFSLGGKYHTDHMSYSYRKYPTSCQDVSFAPFRHLPVCDRTARAMGDYLGPVRHARTVDGFLTLREGLLFVLQVMSCSALQLTEATQKY